MMKRIAKYIVLFYIMLIVFSAACRKSDFTLPESEVLVDAGSGIGNTTWTNDKTYILDGLVFVNEGQVLEIEAGTVIKARTGQQEDASALIIARGGKIIAKGTAENPIIFTVEGDDLEGSVPPLSTGLWGGLIILGNAPVNTQGGETMMEGLPVSEPRALYGGDDPEDNSGILRYVSIRHGGTKLNDEREINGLTFGGVGSGTTLDHVEVISSLDDGIEFFGGTVNGKHLISAFCGDEAFDFDQGYQGKGQFWLGIQHSSRGNFVAEHDGGTFPVNGRPYSIPKLANVTYIGRGDYYQEALMQFNDNGGGKYFNSLFFNQKNGIFIQFLNNQTDSYSQFLQGNIVFKNNDFYQVADNDAESIMKLIGNMPDDSKSDSLNHYFVHAGNQIQSYGMVFEAEKVTYPLQANGASDNLKLEDSWYNEVNYKGAFYDNNWTVGWSLLSQSEYLQWK